MRRQQRDNGALSFARFRHTDTDLVREARQQDFIRWAKSQYPISRLLSNRDRLLRIFGKHSQSDKHLHSLDGLLKVFDLVANMEGRARRSSRFRSRRRCCRAAAPTR